MLYTLTDEQKRSNVVIGDYLILPQTANSAAMQPQRPDSRRTKLTVKRVRLPALALPAGPDPKRPSCLNKYVYPVTPNSSIKRVGMTASQYCTDISSLRDAAVRSDKPRKARMRATKAEASDGRSSEDACGYGRLVHLLVVVGKGDGRYQSHRLSQDVDEALLEDTQICRSRPDRPPHACSRTFDPNMDEKSTELPYYSELAETDSSVQGEARSKKNHVGKVILLLLTLWIPLRVWWAFAPSGTAALGSSERLASKVLKENPLIDGHNDLLMLIRYLYHNEIYADNFTNAFEHGGLFGQFDIPRAKQGQMGGVFWSAFMPCPSNGFDFSDENYAPIVRETLEQLDLFHRMSEKYPEYFTPSSTAKEAEHKFDKEGKFISPVIIEGLHQIGNSLATLRLYHQLGVRYATLNWNCHNAYSDAAMTIIDGETSASKPFWGGVSPAGRDLILEMNRLGMMVDLSHVSVDTMRDVLGGSPEKGWNGSIAPPIFSHSSVKSICPHPRNVPDDILDLVKERDSLVMINFSPDFISCKAGNKSTGIPDYVEETNTIEHVVKHIMYIGEKIGYDHVGLGSDFDGIPTVPRGLEDVSKYPALVKLLLDKGVSEHDAGKVVGRNLLRVWHEADRVAAKLQKEIDPVEDVLQTGNFLRFPRMPLLSRAKDTISIVFVDANVFVGIAGFARAAS
nr:dipeptidase glij [Quercus suber]